MTQTYNQADVTRLAVGDTWFSSRDAQAVRARIFQLVNEGKIGPLTRERTGNGPGEQLVLTDAQAEAVLESLEADPPISFKQREEYGRKVNYSASLGNVVPLSAMAEAVGHSPDRVRTAAIDIGALFKRVNKSDKNGSEALGWDYVLIDAAGEIAHVIHRKDTAKKPSEVSRLRQEIADLRRMLEERQ